MSFHPTPGSRPALPVQISHFPKSERGGTENTKNKFKRRLNELFGRRNIIAHQSDRAHTDAQVNIITKEIVQNFICDIEKIVRSIDAEARNK